MPSTENKGKLALVVDDSVMQCKVLSVLLKEEGYSVVTANDGAQGVATYISSKPDLVLMDINMPIMDGYEAARKIKGLSDSSLCPLIFITSMDTDKAFIEAIDAGGDGILVRPFSPDVFKAKIKSIQRISDLYSQVKKLQLEQQQDAELAEQLMSGVIEARNYAQDKIGIVKKAADLFSGDIQLTAACPNGDVNVLLGDFTGHGLRSSIGAIPLAETFRVMTKKGFTLNDIIIQINRQLYDLLPADLFLAATFVCVSGHDESIYIFNAGLPHAYIMDKYGKIKQRVTSFHPPLGVLPELIPNTKVQVVGVNKSDRVVLISDGIVEARNRHGDMFEFERFESSLIRGVLKKDVSGAVLDDINEFCQDMPQEDDISLIDIPCDCWQAPVLVAKDFVNESSNTNINEITFDHPTWSCHLDLTAARLEKVNPIPMMLNQVHEIEDSAEHWQNLYTILTELYVNALDHGVLGLSSSIKNSAEGFAQYFKEREQRLNELDSGFVNLSMKYYGYDTGGSLLITVEDSGNGFDYYAFKNSRTSMGSESAPLSGRGLELLEQLCERLSFIGNGNKVEALYTWSSK